jgi:hypothetical protein
MEGLRTAVITGDFETFKALVDAWKSDAYFVVSWVIFWLETDDVKWIEYCKPVQTYRNGTSLLSSAVVKDKPNIVLSLLRSGFDVNYSAPISNTTPIEVVRSKQTAKYLIEFGCDPPRYDSSGYYSNFATDVINARNRIRHRAIITLGANRCRSRYRAKGGFTDVLQIIARCVWSARLSEFVWD